MCKSNSRLNAVLLMVASQVLVNCSQTTQGTGTGGSSTTGGTIAHGGTIGTNSTVGGRGGSSVGGTVATGGTTGSSARTIQGDACTVAAPTHWDATVYVVRCSVEVKDTLTIAPGAIIKFAPGFYLNVQAGGTLSAIGTDSLPILFTSLKDDAHGGDSGGDGPTVAARNDWGCQGQCGDLNIAGEGSVLDHVQDLYGSNGEYVQAKSVQIKNSIFAHHNTYGLVLDNRPGVETTLVDGNAFFDNNGYPLRMGKAIFLSAMNSFHDPDNPDTMNAKQCIELDTDIDQLTLLGVTELGFLFSGHSIRAELLLSPPGVIFKAQNDSIKVAAGASFANGPNMIFTSYKDDSVGGDCTGDGPSTPKDGDWQGLWIDDGSKADWAAPADYIRYAAKSGTMLLPSL